MKSKISDLLAIRYFIRDSLLGPGYAFPRELSPAIDLSDVGERIHDEVRNNFPDTAESDMRAALLAKFAAGEDLLINVETSSTESLVRIIGKEIGERRINYPLVFGRSLHDEFIDNFGMNPIETLSPEQTQRLVGLTPQGIFQLGEWVCGPFGLLDSQGSRYLRPQTCGPVIRCSQVGCNQLHHIQMSTSETKGGKVYKYLTANYPISVELQRQLLDVVIPDSEYYRVNHSGGLPWLLGNGFTHDELSIIAESVFNSNANGIRERVNGLIGGSAARRPATQLVSSLSHAHLLQLLLLLDDECIVEHVESVIDDAKIALSSTEVRKSFENRHLNGGYFRVDAEASRLGVRFVPRRMNLTVPRMLAAIREVFSGANQSALNWQLRNEIGADSLEKLERGLEEQDPRELVSRILFSSQEALERTFHVVQYGRFTLPESREAEDLLVDKLLWKFGTPMPTPESPRAALDRYVAHLHEAMTSDYPSEDARIIAIRSAGMDMFVELETLLRSSSEFACWGLLNDHYDLHPLDRFRYSRDRARLFSQKIYSDESTKRGSIFQFNSERGNPLSVLIDSFRVLSEVCESRYSVANNFLRPRWQFPKFFNHSDVQSFSLHHTSLFLDLRADCRQRLIDCMRSVTLALTRCDVCEVRNSLGHPRDSFPSNERLEEAVQAIRNAVGSLNSAGLLPVIRTYVGESVDEFSRRKIRVSDSMGEEILLTAPNQVMMLDLPSYKEPQIVMLDALFSGSSQPARFAIAEDSEWGKLWYHIGLIDSWLSRGYSTFSLDSPVKI